jgi:DNA polymerase III gamma/tau subunit
MRDSLSAFDQVRAFAGEQIATEDVVTVLGLVGRDLVFDMLEAVVAEDAAAAFALTERAIERGYDLRLLCRELARALRDLLILSVDPSRASDRTSWATATGIGSSSWWTAGRARTCSAGSTCSLGPSRRSGAPISRATTWRWRCSGSCTCGSWCP